MPYFSQDDIAQIGTPPANAVVGVIRISGPNAFAILAKTTRGLEPFLGNGGGRFMRDCRFLLPLKRFGTTDTRAVFECPARALVMPAPNTYTTEDVAEIHVSGAIPVVKAALGAVVAAGARPAEPGEFTFRAFRGGRLTLRQAEAVEEVVRADSEAEKRQALARLGDKSQERIGRWRDQLLDCAARIEAALDFSEEELEGDTAAEIGGIVYQLDQAAGNIAKTDVDAVQVCPDVALVGLANAGKSSLMNALIGDDAVIVSPQASTTRDSIHREVRWHGARFVLSDNPGYDPGGVGAGAEAAARAMKRLAGHDLALWIVDAAAEWTDELEEFARLLTGGIIVVLNKADLPGRIDRQDMVELAERHGLALLGVVTASAETGDGVDEIRRLAASQAAKVRMAGPWNRREIWELSAARECCREAAAELSGPGRLELAADDVRRAMAAFARALGDGYAEETLARIFSRFCIGK